MANQQNGNPCHVKTGEVRLSFLHVLKPYLNPRDAAKPGNSKEPKYSATILVPKSDIAAMQRISAGIEAAKQRGAAEKFGGSIPPKLTIGVRDGDGPRESDGRPYGLECRGHWVINASTYKKPGVVDVNCCTIMNESEVYSGMYGIVSLDFYPFNNNGNKGVAIGLGNLMKTRDGEPLAGGTTAEDDFGAAQGYPAQPQYGAPPSYPQQAPSYPAQPQYGQPAPQYGQQAPQPAPGYPMPAPGYTMPPVQQPQQPAPGYQPNYGAPAAPQYAPPAPQQFGGQQPPQTYQPQPPQYTSGQPQQGGQGMPGGILGVNR